MLNIYLFFFCSSLCVIYLVLEVASDITSTKFLTGHFANVYDSANYCSLLQLNDLNLLAVYYFPFMYIFLLITVLSIFFCLSYNINEITMFSFYCTIILLFGYLLFFTDSLVIFFLAYEMLLVPSFFILYKFAKTRRCVEASYLMFF
jgi:formate hydrogenlyase subunit 3/multisubunit Na+/H+ antiporter MnhD subunit